MVDFQKLKTELERDEKRAAKPYADSVGKITIGIGRNLSDVGLSPVEIDYLYGRDVTEVITDLASFAWFTTLDMVRVRALANMRFNLGYRRFREFKKMFVKLDAGDWTGAAEEMLRSTWAAQVGARATRLAKMMVDGEGYDA